jgi:cytochrome c biogenesis protein ResB
MAIRPDKNVLNEHAKFNTMDKYKAKAMENPVLVADISQMDIGLSKGRGYSKIDLATARELSGNPTLTANELKDLKEKNVKEPTGQFKNKD